MTKQRTRLSWLRWLALLVLLIATLSLVWWRYRPLEARLVWTEGSVVFAEHGKVWKSAPLDTRFRVNDELRTEQDGNARVSVADVGIVRLFERTRVRFESSNSANSLAVRVLEGHAELEATNHPLTVVAPNSTLQLDPGAALDAQLVGDQLVFDVRRGTVTILRDNELRTLQPGQRVRVTLSEVIVEPSEANPSASGGSRGGQAEAPAPASSGVAELPLDAPGRAALELFLGESATLHWKGAELPIRLVAPAASPTCAGSLRVVEPAKGLAPVLGQHSSLLTIKGGVTSYTSTCEGSKGAKKLILAGDDASTPLAAAPPRSEVAADGLTYNVSYQNQLPTIAFRWPDARPGLTTRLELKGTRTLSFDAPGGQREVPSGTLSEGTYSFVFVETGGLRSPAGRLVITFDNAAPLLQIREPMGGVAPSGGQITVAGLVVTGAEVRAAGHVLALDGMGRFREQVAVSPDALALDLQVTRGASFHHYLIALGGLPTQGGAAAP